MKLNHRRLRCPLGRRDRKAVAGVAGVVEVVAGEVLGAGEAVAGEGEAAGAVAGPGEAAGVVLGPGVVEEEVSRAGETMVGGEIMVEEGAMEAEEAMVEEVTEIRMEEVVVDIEDTKSHNI